jgi:hypothetical protein
MYHLWTKNNKIGKPHYLEEFESLSDAIKLRDQYQKEHLDQTLWVETDTGRLVENINQPAGVP